MVEQESTSFGPQQVRWRSAAVILILMAAAMSLILIEPDFVRGIHAVATMAVLGAGSIAMAVWFFRYSRLSRGQRRTAGWVMLVIAVALVGSLRIDGWDGAMRPIFAWRFSPTAEQRFAASRTTAVSAAVDYSAQLPEAASDDFPGFLGADRRGVVEGVKLDRDWNANPPMELWRKPIGLGWSAFAVSGKFAITEEQRGDQECVVCYDLPSGEQRWEHADAARFSETLGGDGPRATPTVDQGRVFALGATGILNCLDQSTGQRIWSRNILTDAGATNIQWGMAGSPLVIDSRVIVAPGGGQGRSAWAYDVETGEPVWNAGEDPAAYSSPLLTTLSGQPQVLLLTAKSLVSHDPASGRLLWRYEWRADQSIKCAQPLPLGDFGYAAGKDQVLVSSGYGIGSQLLQIKREGDAWQVEPLWSTRQLRAKFSNMLVHGEYVYGLDEGILTCLDLRKGDRQWKQGRYGYGQMLLVGDVLLIQAESGDVVQVEATPRGHRELARLKALTDKTWNNPALAGRYLLVRNDREAACYELPLAK